MQAKRRLQTKSTRKKETAASLWEQSSLSAHAACFDKPLALIAIAMAIYGIVVIVSAVRYMSGTSYIVIQCVAIVLGIVCMLLASLFDFERLMRPAAIPLFLFTVAILVLTLIIGTGEGSNKSWIRFSILPIGVQPSEFAKIFFILTFSYHLSCVKKTLSRPLTVLSLCAHFGIIAGCVLLQGDLGSALVFVFVFLCMMFAAGLQLRYFLLGALATVVASPFLWESLSHYQRQRILVGFSPESDPQGFGYQVLRAKEAISNGGLWGMGYMEGALSQAARDSTLPKRHTDMIFAVLSEELGFVGVLIYLALFTLLIIRMLFLAKRFSGTMGSYLAVGAAAVFLFQGLENMGMCMGILPVIGLTLPFMSYGGSSVVSLFLLIGVVEGAVCHARTADNVYP